jgi:hypothetical protein
MDQNYSPGVSALFTILARASYTYHKDNAIDKWHIFEIVNGGEQYIDTVDTADLARQYIEELVRKAND